MLLVPPDLDLGLVWFRPSRDSVQRLPVAEEPGCFPLQLPLPKVMSSPELERPRLPRS